MSSANSSKMYVLPTSKSCIYLLLAFSGSVVGRLCQALYFRLLPLGQLITLTVNSIFRESILSTITRADFSTSEGDRSWVSSNNPCSDRLTSVTTIQSPELEPSEPLSRQALTTQSALGKTRQS